MQNLLITGANRGIGLAITDLALSRGERVFAGCRQPAKAIDLINLQRRYSDECEILSIDVVDEKSLREAALKVTEHIDLLVCNAGTLNGYGGIMSAENTMESFRNVLTTNAAGPFFTTRSFLPHLKRSKSGGRVAIISSLMGSQSHTSSNAYAYRSSKAAANNIALTLSNELRDEKIAVAAYHPGWVRTEMGGPNGDIAAKESATGLMQRFDELSLADSGCFINYNGERLAL